MCNFVRTRYNKQIRIKFKKIYIKQDFECQNKEKYEMQKYIAYFIKKSIYNMVNV